VEEQLQWLAQLPAESVLSKKTQEKRRNNLAGDD